jgi:type I restriction enzyme S subunit
VPDVTRLKPKYLNYFLNWQRAQKYLKQLATRGASQSNISATKLRNLKIGLPDVDEQEKVVNILEVIDAKITIEESCKNALEELFRSTLEQLMTGQIRLTSDIQ